MKYMNISTKEKNILCDWPQVAKPILALNLRQELRYCQINSVVTLSYAN